MARKPKPSEQRATRARARPKPGRNHYKLTDAQRAEIVTRLALYDSVSDITAELNAQGVEITRQAVSQYNPDNNIRLAQQWRELFFKTRESWAAEIMAEPIAQRAFRLRRLGKIHEAAMQRGAYVIAASMLEQAAKEMGNVYSNVLKTQASGKVDHTHKIEEVTPEERRNMLSDRLKEAMEAARNKAQKAAPTTH